jgi:hypothetical protein
MGQCKGVREVGYFDCDGGGQIVVDGNYAFIVHVNGTTGTTIVDVGDPKNPRQVANIPTAPGIHAHKVRAANGLMLVNREHPPRRKGPALTAEELSQPVGLGIYDISDPRRPKEITMWRCTGNGVHRFTFDGRYAYISPEMEGYIGNIVMILDLEDPGRPEEVGRWWMPGQWIAGGETPGWKGRAHRCHHPIRLGDRLYTSYWHGGAVILDISDMRRPKCVGAIDWSPPFPWPTHSCVPVPFPLAGRRWMLVADEDVLPLDPELTGEMAAFMWMVDITDEARPMPVASFQVDGVNGKRNREMTGCHQPIEDIRDTEVPFAWFAQGLRFVDIANPNSPREVASYVPDVPAGADRVCSNDVFRDQRGLVYVIDRVRGFHIVERTGN